MKPGALKNVGWLALMAAAVSANPVAASAAASYSSTVFATGAAVNATAPDSVTYGGGSVWVEYGNGANSSNYTGASTIVQYSLSGAVQNTYSLAGSVDGLKYNPTTGQVWALQNQDGNSQLSIINPATKAITTYMYGAPYPSVASSRGFDDVAFVNGSVFLSETNPSASTDPVVVKLNSSNLATPISFTTALTGASILATDPDSLKSTPTGGLILTGEGDGALTFIANPGLATQTASSVALSGANGFVIGKPDDSVYATSAVGTFYVADTSANTVYAITGSGLNANSSLFVSVGTAFGSVDAATGIVTPVITGLGLHGADFVAAPEPATLAMMLAGFGLVGASIVRKRRAS